MNLPKTLPPLSELQEIFAISNECASGLIWKVNPSRQGGRKAGTPAGGIPNQGPQYWRVKYKQKFYQCHRIRLSLLNNRLVLPEEYVDHVDGQSKDNRGALRIVTLSQNQYNRSRKVNTSGFRWVVHTNKALKNPWRIIITINGKREYFGYYADPVEAAIKADQIAIEKLGLDYIRLNFPELQLKNKR